MRQQRVDQRARLGARRGVDDHAGRLVDDDQVRRPRRRCSAGSPRAAARRRRRAAAPAGNARPARTLRARSGPRAVRPRDRTLGDQLRDARARQRQPGRRGRLGQRAVEAQPGLLRRDLELDRFGVDLGVRVVYLAVIGRGPCSSIRTTTSPSRRRSAPAALAGHRADGRAHPRGPSDRRRRLSCASASASARQRRAACRPSRSPCPPAWTSSRSAAARARSCSCCAAPTAPRRLRAFDDRTGEPAGASAIARECGTYGAQTAPPSTRGREFRRARRSTRSASRATVTCTPPGSGCHGRCRPAKGRRFLARCLMSAPDAYSGSREHPRVTPRERRPTPGPRAGARVSHAFNPVYLLFQWLDPLLTCEHPGRHAALPPVHLPIRRHPGQRRRLVDARARSRGPGSRRPGGRSRRRPAIGSDSGRAPVDSTKTVSPSSGLCAGRIARAMPSCAIIATRSASPRVSATSVAITPSVVFVPAP